MTSRSLRASRSKGGILSKLKSWEAGREMNVARGKAAQSRSGVGHSNKAKLALGKSAAKDMIAATRKKALAEKGK